MVFAKGLDEALIGLNGSPAKNRLSSRLYGRKLVAETPPIKLSNFIYPSTPLYSPFKLLHRTPAQISRKCQFSHAAEVTQEICGLTSKRREGLYFANFAHP